MVYAVAESQTGDIVTRDYVAYMISSRVLFGAEFDKVVSLLLVTVVLSLAIVRARRLLVSSVSESAAAEDEELSALRRENAASGNRQALT